MIDLSNISNDLPHARFLMEYRRALELNQANIEAVCISSVDSQNKPHSRYVNLKFVNDNEWIFFSNYNSPKSLQFSNNNSIAALFFWPKTNIQIRIKAEVARTKMSFSDEYFYKRSKPKNALAIISRQSKTLDSYNNFVDKYNRILEQNKGLDKRPDYWGGFSFIPNYFEFWEGNKNRLNKREIYILENGLWERAYLQP